MKYRQEPPFCIQVEMTEGCNLYCDFCGLQGVRTKKEKNLKFMTPKLANELSLQIARAGWNSRIEFAMHGEPTLNNDMVEIIRAFRSNIPKVHLMITSNGGGLIKNPHKTIEDLFDAGLNVLALDSYEYVNIVPKILSKLEGAERSFNIHYYPEERSKSPNSRYPISARNLIVVKDISTAEKGTHSKLNNHCGAAAPLDFSASGKKCAKPFREISVRWNGAISICCNDWRGEYKCGNISKEPIDSIWNGKAFSIARKFLYNGMRDFSPCYGCNSTSYRIGLLPDKQGKLSLPKPSKKDRKEVSEFTKGRSFTIKVKREWEK